MASTLFVSPYVGEFGWELFNWQGHVRWLAEYYEKTIVACRRGSSYIYEDFADSILEVDPPIGDTENNICHGYVYDNMHKNYDHDDWLDPRMLAFYIEEHGIPTIGNRKQKFIKYGENQQSPKYDVVLHARNTHKVNSSERNWPLESWNTLVQMFPKLTFASIGTKNAALHVDGTDDCRGLNLDIVCGILNKANYIVGPSSGPMHLGSLCGTNQVVWSGHSRNEFRYKTLWNPFNTNVTYIATWQPTIELIGSIL